MAPVRSTNPPTAPQGRGKKRQSKYIQQNSKRRKELELRAGLQGFLITCDGGRERLSCREAVLLVERFYEKLNSSSSQLKNLDDIQGKADDVPKVSVDAVEEKVDDALEVSLDNIEGKADEKVSRDADTSSFDHVKNDEVVSVSLKKEEEVDSTKKKENSDGSSITLQSTNIEALLEEEMAELRDKKQARFASLETGCAALVFVRMLKDDTSCGPNEVVNAIIDECMHKKRPLTRYCLRFLPIQGTCYASAEEVMKMAEPLLTRHFPVCEKDKALKFAVVYEARANTSLDRMEIIKTVAKLVPEPHSVDLKNPDKTIIVQIVKTICAIGVVTNYKQYSKYNIRLLTSPPTSLEQENTADTE